ncbi:10 kDa heat shock protein, mitochondrial [Pelodytes ibericus]
MALIRQLRAAGSTLYCFPGLCSRIFWNILLSKVGVNYCIFHFNNKLINLHVILQAGQAFKKFLPLFDRVLVERFAAETVTKGGIMLPEKSQGKVLQATVVAVGGGSKGKNGEVQSVSVKVGDKILLPEYGGTKVMLDDKDYFLFRDADILGKYVD